MKLFLIFFAVSLSAAEHLSPVEMKIVQTVDATAAESNALLEKIVNINSGTFNTAGVRAVGEVLRPEFEKLGFQVRWIPMDDVHRAGHLVAERKGTQGKRVMLIGHMDTVFEPSSPFQKWTMKTATVASGPGTSDMKGGLMVILFALKAMQAAGTLDGANITVFLTGDEENAGEPLTISRRDFIATGKASEAAIEFEGGSRSDGRDFATIARRSASLWTLKTTGVEGHSAGIFTERAGSGAIYEISRILAAFESQLKEPDLTYNTGVIVGGSNVAFDAAKNSGTAIGKPNIIASTAYASGDIRTVTDEQLQRVREKMKQIVAKHLPRTGAEITFEDKYPSMAATEGNKALLKVLNGLNLDLNMEAMEPLPPAKRGAGDVSFVAPYVDSISGFGSLGGGAHAPGETIDLSRQPVQTKRAALFIYRLTR
ncbi:MAG: peptidase [Bryobacterales bacterium]|nr:peptidase [Bryobacterales bacterium]